MQRVCSHHSFEFMMLTMHPAIYLILCSSLASVRAVRVTTTTGVLEGTSYTEGGKQVFAFRGVPYAQPPVGKRRFDEPKPVKNWTGVWPAVDFAPRCIQLDIRFFKIEGEEDCLYLNIYTPDVSKRDLPTLVFFHGGAFMYGWSGYYKPTFLLGTQDVILVTVGYRLGPFGFLSTEDAVVPGNNGLKDQAMALSWLRDNIERFGGGKDKVTISGNSAGGASVHYHYFSPHSRGLFSKGILSSGSSLMSWSFTDGALQKAKMLAASVGCSTDCTIAMMKCLKHRPSRQILGKIQSLLMPWGMNPFTPFGPVVEKSGKNPFLSEHPLQLLLRGEVFDAPVLAGVTTEEGLYPVATFIDRDGQLQYLNDHWYDVAPHFLDFNYTTSPENFNTVSSKVREYYFKGEEISERTQDKVIEMAGDRLFNAGMDLAIRTQASVVSSNIYLYQFGFKGKVTLSNLFTVTKKNFGASHFDECYYVLTMQEGLALTESDEREMIKIMTDMWISFMNSGKPRVSNVDWTPIEKSSIDTGKVTYIRIASPSDVSMESSDDFGSRRFWESLDLHENIMDSTGIKDEL